MDSTLTIFSIRTDQEIVAAIRDGNEPLISKAVTVLYGHRPFFYAYVINRLVNGRHPFNRSETLKDLEEIYRDAVLLFMERVQKDPPEFEVGDKGTIKTFIFKTGRFKYWEKWRERARLNRNKGKYLETQEEASMDDIFKNESEERAADVQQAIQELDKDCMHLLDLRYNKELAPRDIGSRYSESSNNISQKLLRCRDKLKKILIAKYKFPERLA